MKKSISFLLLILAIGSFIICNKNEHEHKYGSLIKNYIKAWNNVDFNLLDKVVDPGFVIYSSPEFNRTDNLQQIKQRYLETRKTYKDFIIENLETVYGDGKIAVRWRIKATLIKNPGSVKIDVPGISILHIRNNKIMDEWISNNDYLWFKKMGYRIEPPADSQ